MMMTIMMINDYDHDDGGGAIDGVDGEDGDDDDK